MTNPVFDLLPGGTLVIYEGDGIWATPGSDPKGCGVRVEFSWAAGTLVHFDFRRSRRASDGKAIRVCSPLETLWCRSCDAR